MGCFALDSSFLSFYTQNTRMFCLSTHSFLLVPNLSKMSHYLGFRLFFLSENLFSTFIVISTFIVRFKNGFTKNTLFYQFHPPFQLFQALAFPSLVTVLNAMLAILYGCHLIIFNDASRICCVIKISREKCAERLHLMECFVEERD